MRITSGLLVVIGSLLASAASAQVPQCTVPNTLVNGQVADATDVMENFNAVANCVENARSDGVAHEGTPSVGEIAVFTSPTGITGGDLTGDVSTAGSTATQLAPTGVTPGTYLNPTIVVDAKGRITSAINGSGNGGSGGGEAGVSWVQITLVNPDAESGTTAGWTMIGSGFTALGTPPTNHDFVPYKGSFVFLASASPNPQMYQDFDLSSYAAAIDNGTVRIMMEAEAADTCSTGEQPYLAVLFLNAAGTVTTRIVSPAPAESIGSGQWRHIEVEGRVPSQTRSARLMLWAKRRDGTQNNVAFDEVRAFVGEE